jgi:hypothetical protein
MTGSIANCTQCGSQTFVEPLHGERGGPPYCPICAGAWHAEHGRKRRVARTLIKVMLAYDKAGGKLYDKEFDELKIAACDSGVAVYDADARAAADEFRDLTTELLTATLALTHPDKHPPELKAEANRVTQELLALKPFVFPAPALPAPAPKKPKPDSDELDLSSLKNFRQTYPCEACRDAVTFDYCDTCRAEYEKREREESEKRTKKQRAEYKLRRKLALAEREQRKCATCGMKFRVSRTDARYCSNPCRLRAHRKKQALETDKHSRTTQPSFIRFKSLENRILAVLKKHPAVFLNDILPVERTRAEYQALCLAAVKLEDEGRIESLSYWCRYSRPGHKVLHRPGYEIKDSHKIPRLKREA